MLEPLIVLTVLNCIFMFSSTVTTCALWWQYQHNRCCVKRTTKPTSDLKRSKSGYTFRTVKKPTKSQSADGYVDVNIISKPGTNADREVKHRSQKKRLKYLAEYQKKSREKAPIPNEPKGKTRLSEASQTINDTKSTVVMEFSTVQKVVQIVDNDSDINPPRGPFKDIVIQRDTTDKKYSRNDEQDLATDIATATSQ